MQKIETVLILSKYETMSYGVTEGLKPVVITGVPFDKHKAYAVDRNDFKIEADERGELWKFANISKLGNQGDSRDIDTGFSLMLKRRPRIMRNPYPEVPIESLLSWYDDPAVQVKAFGPLVLEEKRQRLLKRQRREMEGQQDANDENEPIIPEQKSGQKEIIKDYFMGNCKVLEDRRSVKNPQMHVIKLKVWNHAIVEVVTLFYDPMDKSGNCKPLETILEMGSSKFFQCEMACIFRCRISTSIAMGNEYVNINVEDAVFFDKLVRTPMELTLDEMAAYVSENPYTVTDLIGFKQNADDLNIDWQCMYILFQPGDDNDMEFIESGYETKKGENTAERKMWIASTPDGSNKVNIILPVGMDKPSIVVKLWRGHYFFDDPWSCSFCNLLKIEKEEEKTSKNQ